LLWHSGDEADAAEHAGRDEAGAKRKEEKETSAEAGSRKQHRAGADPGKGPKEGTKRKTEVAARKRDVREAAEISGRAGRTDQRSSEALCKGRSGNEGETMPCGNMERDV